MLSSLLLSLALGWLTNFDGSDCPCVTMQATYEVGFCDDSKDCKDASCKACCQEACKVTCEAACKSCCDEDCLPADMVMCGGEPIDMPKAQEKAVVLQVRVVQAPNKLVVGGAAPVFLNADQLRTCLTSVQSDHKGQVLSSPTLILCSGQEGSLKIGCEASCGSSCDKCESHSASPLKALGLSAKPCISADGQFVRLRLECATTIGSDKKGVNQESAVHLETVLRDGMTIAIPGAPCSSKNCCPEHVVIMATVRIADDKAHPVAAPTACTREMPSCVSATACCEDCEKCDTVESNLAKLQKASELCKLAELYERLDQCETAGKILANVTHMCPGSRIASQAQEDYTDIRMKEIINNAKNLAELQKEWEKVLFTGVPSQVKVGTHGEEAEAPVKCSKLEQVLGSYRKACREGNKDQARQLAIEALTLDQTCFAK